jgi:hypothetical protein
MEDTLDDDLSFFEKSCEKLRRDIERYSTLRDRAHARDSGIHTIIEASADRDINPYETVILPNDASVELENNSSNHVTVRKAEVQNAASGRENLMVNALYSYLTETSVRTASTDTPARAATSREIRRGSEDIRIQQDNARAHSMERAAQKSTVSRRETEVTDFSSKGSRCNIKPATFDRSHSWLDYKSHFDACTALNNWSERERKSCT